MKREIKTKRKRNAREKDREHDANYKRNKTIVEDTVDTVEEVPVDVGENEKTEGEERSDERKEVETGRKIDTYTGRSD